MVTNKVIWEPFPPSPQCGGGKAQCRQGRVSRDARSAGWGRWERAVSRYWDHLQRQWQDSLFSQKKKRKEPLYWNSQKVSKWTKASSEQNICQNSMPYFCKIDGLDNVGENRVVLVACTHHHQEQFKTWNFCDHSTLPFSRIFCAAIRANTLQDTDPELSFLVPLYPFDLPQNQSMQRAVICNSLTFHSSPFKESHP